MLRSRSSHLVILIGTELLGYLISAIQTSVTDNFDPDLSRVMLVRLLFFLVLPQFELGISYKTSIDHNFDSYQYISNFAIYKSGANNIFQILLTIHQLVIKSYQS